MKRIVLSLSTVLMVGALAVGATGAFFSDTETSANNIFTAGSIDLKIDHSLSTYNGAGNSLVIVSDPQTQVDAHAAAIITDTPITTQYWTASSSPLLAGSAWIWSENPAANDAINNNVQKTFTRTFNWNGPVTSATLAIAADNRYQIVSLNSCTNVDAGAGMASNDQHVAADSYNVTGCIVSGVNTLVVLGQNDAQASPPDQAQNPAGVRFRLEIQGQDTTFSDPIDLNGQTFWNFNDVKPADNGRDDFSLHVDTNDAWTCMLVGNVKNDENDLIEPEATAGDTTPGIAGIGDGELGQYLSLFLWHDINHDGIYQPGTESPLGGGGGIFTNLFTGAGTSSIPIHDSVSDGVPQPGGSTDYVGSAWCAGTLSVDGGGNVTCDGSSVSNTAQTDSTKADLTFYATQSRNQPSFTCSSLGGGGGCNFNADANLVQNGGFENPEVTSGEQWDIFPSPAAGWNILWRDPAPVSPLGRPDTANLELHEGVLGASFEGDQYAELDSDWDGHANTLTGEPAATVIYQDIPTQIGAHYSLTYRFAPRPNTPASDNNLESRLGGVVMGTTGPTAGGGSNLTPSDWVLEGPFDFTATTTTTRLQFTDLGTTNNSLGTFIDDVQLKQTSCVNPVS